jgi:hypothetical protein
MQMLCANGERFCDEGEELGGALTGACFGRQDEFCVWLRFQQDYLEIPRLG